MRDGGTVYRSPHTVTCPTCGAGPGNPCVRVATGGGGYMERWHMTRERVPLPDRDDDYTPEAINRTTEEE